MKVIFFFILITLITSCLQRNEQKAEVHQHEIKVISKPHPFFNINDCDSLSSFPHSDTLIKLNFYDSLYLPKTVLEALNVLDTGSNEYAKHLFKICDEIEFHFGLGMWMRNNWGLWTMSDLAIDYFDIFGESHIDDISNNILMLNRLILNKDTVKLNRFFDFEFKYTQDSSKLLAFKSSVLERFDD